MIYIHRAASHNTNEDNCRMCSVLGDCTIVDMWQDECPLRDGDPHFLEAKNLVAVLVMLKKRYIGNTRFLVYWRMFTMVSCVWIYIYIYGIIHIYRERQRSFPQQNQGIEISHGRFGTLSSSVQC